jgi:CBS-domain-containing membrane protein
LAVSIGNLIALTFGRRLRRDILVALLVKFALIAAIYGLCFGPGSQPPSDAEATAAALIGPVVTRVSR